MHRKKEGRRMIKERDSKQKSKNFNPKNNIK